MSLVIRCDVGKEIGLGHYFRSILIKEAFEKKGIDACLALRNIDGGNFSLSYDLLIDANQTEGIEGNNFKNRFFIMDVLHHKNHQNDELENYLVNLKKGNNRLIFIEGLGDDECPSHYYPYLDALVTPYVNATTQKRGLPHFFGKDFLILCEARVLKKKDIKKIGKQILITFGGSDSRDQSIKTLEVLQKVNCSEGLEVIVIVGPLMTNDQINAIQQRKYKFKKLDLIHSPENLKNYFEWADLAITNTGHTRYELAASGVPFIIAPFNDNGYDMSLIFSELNAASLVPYRENMEQNALIGAVSGLLDNYEKRLNMSINGKKHFYNPGGADALVDSLMKVWQ